MQDQIDNLNRQYRAAGRETLGRIRTTLGNSAEWVAQSTQPLSVLTEKTLKLNRISHNSAARLVRVQATFLEGTLEGAAQRLQAAAHADNVRTAFDAQMQLMPATRERIVSDARKTVEVLGDTRDDVVALVRETLDALRIPNKVADAVDNAADAVEETVEKVRREAKPAVRNPRISTPRKTAKRTTAARKTTARKTPAASRGAATRKTRSV